MINSLIHLVPKFVTAGPPDTPADFKYKFGKPYNSARGLWKHYRGTSKANGAPVSIFSLSVSKQNNQEELLAAGRNNIEHLKELQATHKKLDSLVLLDDFENSSPDGSSTTIFLVTEPVMPLSELLRELCLGLGELYRSFYFENGLYRIARVVNYLHDHLQAVHGNISLASIVVTRTPQLEWKLHGFDVLSEACNFTEPSTPMQLYKMLVESQYIPPELCNYEQTKYPWAIDSWGLSCLMYEVFTGKKLARPEDLDDPASIPSHLRSYFYRLSHVNPSTRLRASYIQRAFKNNGPYVLLFPPNVRHESILRRVDNIFLQKARNLHKNIKKFQKFSRYFVNFNKKSKPLKLREGKDARRELLEWESGRFYSPIRMLENGTIKKRPGFISDIHDQCNEE